MHLRRDILVLASRVRSLPGKQFSDRENDLINGRANTVLIPHDPYSNGYELYGQAYAPVPGYVNPEGRNDIAHRYMSAVEIPFLDPMTKKARTGLRCKECHLRLLFLTCQWASGAWQGFVGGGTKQKLADDLRSSAMLRDCSEQDLEAHRKTPFPIDDFELKFDFWKKQKPVNAF